MIGKKGTADLFIILTALLTITFLTMLTIYVNGIYKGKMVDILEKDGSGNTSLAYKAVIKAESIFRLNLDRLFLGIFIILLIGMVALSIFISASPIYIPIYLIISVVAVWLAAIISNVYQTIEGKGIFASALTWLPMQSWIMNNLPWLTTGFAFLLIISTYSKYIFPRQSIPR